MRSVKWMQAGFFIALLFALALAGCGSDPEPTATPELTATPQPTATTQPTATPPPTATLQPISPLAAPQSPLPTPPSAADSPLAPPAAGHSPVASPLVAGNNGFTFALYQRLRTEEGNLFFSPYSISLALAMTYAGARGETAEQMAVTLHYTLPPSELHERFHALNQELTGAAAGDAFELHLANSLWAQSGYPFHAEYLALLADLYESELREVDFVDPDAREQARQAINEWVSDETQGKIEELFAEGVLNEMTRLVLANAIYFKAEWEQTFQPVPMPQQFTLLNGEAIMAPMMTRRAATGYSVGPDYEALQLAYQGERMEMVILLPGPGAFAAVEASLDADFINAVAQNLTPIDMRLTMPKFEYESSFALAETLAAMSMPIAFMAGLADFSGMADGDLFLSHVEHKAYVAVDELGTEAAAATGVVAEATSSPQLVNIDRPFLFLIRDRESGAVLFVGRVLDPTSS
jgi:serpin B